MQPDTRPLEHGIPSLATSYPSRPRETLGVPRASVHPQQDTGALTDAVLAALFGDSARPRRRGRTPAIAIVSD
jgi:hypothetical protein